MLGVLVNAVDRDGAVNEIMQASRARRGFAASALAVHGIMTGAFDASHRHRLNSLDLALPDGQPVRWALNLLYRAGLAKPVRGTDLTLGVLAAAEGAGVPVFFYGSRVQTLARLSGNVAELFPRLHIAGMQPSRFGRIDSHELIGIAAEMERSGAGVVFVGLGCPRQETFVIELRRFLPLPAVAVGAAFDYMAGVLPEPPAVFQRMGVEWFWRLLHEPRRLWRRYVFLNPAYLVGFVLQATRLWRPSVAGRPTSLDTIDA